MKNRIIPLLFITIFTVFIAKAGDPMSFNGQNGKDPNARNMTIDEWLDLIIRGKTTDDLAYYTVCPQDVLQSHISAVTIPAQRILLQQLNFINDKHNGKLWAINGVRAQIKTAAEAEEVVRAFVVSKPLESGKTYRYISLDNSLNGKTGVVIPRPIYFDGEEGFFLQVPNTDPVEEYLLASAACANPTPVGEFSGKKPASGSIEQFDTAYSGHGVTVINNITIDNSGNFNNSGNNTLTVAPTKAAADNGDIEELQPEHHEPEEARSRSRSGGNSGGSDDTYYDDGGRGGARAISTSDSHNETKGNGWTLLSGNTIVLGGGGSYQQQPVYNGGGGRVPRWRNPPPPCTNCTPPINTGGHGRDYGGVNTTEGGRRTGRDWSGVE